MNPFLLLTLAYLVGAVPTSHWVGKGIYGVDLRDRGSGNLGATNTFRVLGWKAAAPVVAFDVVKGWLPVWLLPRFLGVPELGWTLAFGAAAILGHVFSAWVRFRGGKGVATSAGVFLALAPWGLLAAAVVFFVLSLATRIVSVGSVAAAAALPVAVALTPHVGGHVLVAFSAALAAFVIWAHRANIRRLLRGEENRFGRAAAPDPEVPTSGPARGAEGEPSRRPNGPEHGIRDRRSGNGPRGSGPRRATRPVDRKVQK